MRQEGQGGCAHSLAGVLQWDVPGLASGRGGLEFQSTMPLSASEDWGRGP